jgi:hypothetical protein
MPTLNDIAITQTRIVHFKPLGIGTVREILGKLVRELNDWLADAVIAFPP